MVVALGVMNTASAIPPRLEPERARGTPGKVPEPPLPPSPTRTHTAASCSPRGRDVGPSPTPPPPPTHPHTTTTPHPSPLPSLAVTTACARLAKGGDQLGGLFGVLESVEAVAGMVGPAAGGLLTRTHEHATLGAVVGCYSGAFVLVLLFFRRHIVDPAGHEKKAD